MAEWWTYRPSDFLMFSARSWGRLLERWNGELWPWQAAIVAAGAALVALAAFRPERSRRAILAVLALAWAAVGWAFHWDRFADINTGARGFAVAFAVQALLLGIAALQPPPTRRPPRFRPLGLVVAALAVLAYPLIAPATGLGWAQSELALAMPDPTALLTVGLLLALPVRWKTALLLLPFLALAIGAATAWLLRVK